MSGLHVDEGNDVEAAVAAIAKAGVVAVVDEWAGTGDLVTAAQAVAAAQVNFLAQHGGGLTGLALSAGRVAALGLPPMSARWDQPRKPFAISIEARRGVTTGISAADRARTIRVAVDPGTRPEDLVSPGHVFPLRAHPDGIAAARGRVEAALALVRMAGFEEGAVLTEVLDQNGELAGPRALRALAQRLGIPLVPIGEVVRRFYRGGAGSDRGPAEPARSLLRLPSVPGPGGRLAC
jgi:3,4-dihydroxy 2-butanone 4-phosphate synthase / GTP cyclohydrolase II